MQGLIFEGDFDVNFSFLSLPLDKMNSISDLYLFSINQFVPSPTHFCPTGVPFTVDIVFLPSTPSSRCAQAKPLLLTGILINLIYFPSDIIHPALIPLLSNHYHPSKIKFPSLTALLKKHLFNKCYLNCIISSLVIIHFKLSSHYHLSSIHVSYILLLTHHHYHLSTNSCISELVSVIDFISDVFNKIQKTKKEFFFCFFFFSSLNISYYFHFFKYKFIHSLN